jgi:sodium/bile acid cotransporter 7
MAAEVAGVAPVKLRVRPDPYLLALLGCVLVASKFPAQGAAARWLDWATNCAIALLFFLYGARLSPRQALDGGRNVRLHLTILTCTYALFPCLGLGLRLALPDLLGADLWLGVSFLCAVPSTVQSSIAFTSLARGNVAAALTSASLSNLIGVIATPLLVALTLDSGVSATATSPWLETLRKLTVQLVVPFFAGQLSRPWLADFVERRRRALSLVDRGSILLVVYAAFSAGVTAGVWRTVSLSSLGWVFLVCAGLLAFVLWFTARLSRWLGFSREDEIAAVFCGSKKSLASGLPMAAVLFPPDRASSLVLPLMLFHQLQLLVCAYLARRYAGLGSAPRENPQ